MKINTQKIMRFIVMLVLFAAVLVIIQLWTNAFEWLLLGKVLGTLTILGGVASFVIASQEDVANEKKLKDEDYLD